MIISEVDFDLIRAAFKSYIKGAFPKELFSSLWGTKEVAGQSVDYCKLFIGFDGYVKSANLPSCSIMFDDVTPVGTEGKEKVKTYNEDGELIGFTTTFSKLFEGQVLLKFETFSRVDGVAVKTNGQVLGTRMAQAAMSDEAIEIFEPLGIGIKTINGPRLTNYLLDSTEPILVGIIALNLNRVVERTSFDPNFATIIEQPEITIN